MDEQSRTTTRARAEVTMTPCTLISPMNQNLYPESNTQLPSATRRSHPSPHSRTSLVPCIALHWSAELNSAGALPTAHIHRPPRKTATNKNPSVCIRVHPSVGKKASPAVGARSCSADRSADEPIHRAACRARGGMNTGPIVAVCVRVTGKEQAVTDGLAKRANIPPIR